MTPGAIAKRYGRALFELAAEEGQAEETGQALAELAVAVESLDEGTLAAGSLSSADRESLATALAERIGAGSLLGRFVGVLATNDRLDQLPAIRGRFDALQDVAAGRVRVRMRSATPLSDEDRQSLRDKFENITGRRVIDTVDLDDDLLGGVTVEVEGRVYDGSVRTQLARLERAMAGSSRQSD